MKWSQEFLLKPNHRSHQKQNTKRKSISNSWHRIGFSSCWLLSTYDIWFSADLKIFTATLSSFCDFFFGKQSIAHNLFIFKFICKFPNDIFNPKKKLQVTTFTWVVWSYSKKSSSSLCHHACFFSKVFKFQVRVFFFSVCKKERKELRKIRSISKGFGLQLGQKINMLRLAAQKPMHVVLIIYSSFFNGFKSCCSCR